MKKNKIIFQVISFVAFFISAININAQTKPNVIYILADDLGYGDLSCYGQKILKTPNIDRLAKKGIKFTDHYSGNAVCSPSRAVLMTGQNPAHVYITGNSKEEPGMDAAMTNLPELFKNAGYATGAFGKWGLGDTTAKDNRNPLNQGFDEFYGWKTQVTAHTYYPTKMVHNGQEVAIKKGTYVHDIIMDHAFDFIKENAKNKQPFFCYIPTAIPHAAMHAPEKLHNKWRKKLPQFDTIIGEYYADPEPTPDVINPIAGFGAMVEHLDNQVGQIVKMLKKYKVDKNTLIIFTSDNGAHHEGGHDPEFWNSNGDLRGGKRDVYEGGIRAPMLAYWPTKIKAGSTTNLPSAFWDVMATMADITNQPIPKQSDGISFLPTLLGNTKNQQKSDYLYWKFTNWEATKQAVRIGNFKGISIHYNKSKKHKEHTAAFELYDLSNDIGETHNIAASKPEMVAKMQKIMKDLN
ncbi:N-acetylgalactosamine 6-sulfate sulfatase [Wenyingzhuangia fucanilytica]|uniref:N-acetylgalactosamine 6-sulfate sulfatase n=1 Tax=Wenyingzhuangia fucanilytica TaxID=1790137 RepID=A0A1B1Y652_9FLAO|nr:arylsulfatase [Wenyingzhuangia fucanilytica]ANW96227.1 N-acetylgalactosamine 6-sulfate sulfatase [Wenyingzhuangia fucanilytica]